MIRIFDYIFYRIYIAYLKANESGQSISPLYLGLCLFFFFIPLSSIIADMMRGDNALYFKGVVAIYCLVIFVPVYIRYMRKGKTRELIGKFSNCSLNRIIPT